MTRPEKALFAIVLVCLSILAAPELLAMWLTRERKS